VRLPTQAQQPQPLGLTYGLKAGTGAGCASSASAEVAVACQPLPSASGVLPDQQRQRARWGRPPGTYPILRSLAPSRQAGGMHISCLSAMQNGAALAPFRRPSSPGFAASIGRWMPVTLTVE